jgi:release factor glutamine methyltransferase
VGFVKDLDRACAFRRGVFILKGAGITNPALDVSILLGHVTGEPPESVLLEREKPLSRDEAGRFATLIERRRGQETVSRLVGKREFFSRVFRTGPVVLDPRPETEILVERALDRLGRLAGRPRVLDVGTGSGIIAVTLCAENPRVSVVATDISLEALKLAAVNARAHGVPERVHFVRGDLANCFSEASGFDLLVSNPPYVTRDEYDSLPAEVRLGDPVNALVAGPEGTEFFTPLALSAGRLLRTGGAILVEVGAGQAPLVEDIFRRSGLNDVETFPDLAGIDRVVTGTR